jgi:putative heme iron utilization protein|tara:strand:+ start:83 stop:322 length:240 start_codon:yes stop_codon:yes gene_type:complete
MFKPSSIASRILVSEIHNADKLERVTNAIELVEVSRLNDMKDTDIIAMAQNYCEDKTQADIIQQIVEYENVFKSLTNEV